MLYGNAWSIMVNGKTQTAGESTQLLRQRRHRTVQRLKIAEVVILVVGMSIVLMHSGFSGVSTEKAGEVNDLVMIAMVMLSGCRIWRFVLSFSTREPGARFLEANLLIPAIWGMGMFGLWVGAGESRLWMQTLLTHGLFSLAAVLSVLAGCRQLAAITRNSAVLLVGSFLVVIGVGTGLLMLPVCRDNSNTSVKQSADWDVAMFTATSASCVTGLIVEPTGSYWSPVGHAVIFGLFQIGGLGIMTFGAFVAVLSGRRGFQFREANTLREMLDADSVRTSRRLLVTILLFTVSVEVLGAVSLLGLWEDLPWRERIWQAIFHSVSAFCNAGFSLNDDGFLNLGGRWQVWGPLTLLIILGGLGFPVVQDLYSWTRWKLKRRPRGLRLSEAPPRFRLTLHSRLVMWTTFGLLLFGAVFWFTLESVDNANEVPPIRQAADAWFQSVTFRTAGFNTVDHAKMQPATKLLSIFLMFIGAAPGSTGGGIKTIVFAIALLNIRAVFRGQTQVEVFGRRIPATQVARSLAMITIGLLIVMVTAAFLVVFEGEADRFLDHLFEATSAFGTVGVSAGVTGGLTLPSRLLICAVMFLGRVGPVTLLLAMASPGESARYDFPTERVSLG